MTGIFQLLLLVSVTLASEPTCPACSKYDYEEKMLERMIRMEFAFEKLDEKLEQNLNKLKEEKARLQEIVDDLKDQQEQAESRLVSLMEEVERNQSSTLKMVVDNSNSTLEQISAAYNNIKEQVLIPAVYFHARSPQTSSLSTGEIIVYKTGEINQGNGYSATTGKFTAPVQGLYMFFMHTCTNTNKYGYLQIVKDGLNLIANDQHETTGITCSSSQVFVNLDIGENVWVQCTVIGSQLYHDEAHRWTSFGGALIHN
ncbi:complement C1q-like protein 2 [Mya arenaria]|uniref:complement C1q-like protein 2 n=1 Tax=Mya arenaria TaxID=6604 RepID=UPI0022E945EA|nr:complement C1q-like protein 2 [Mya arenaria]